MIFDQDRREMRRVFINAWSKYREQQLMQDMEQQIKAVILRPPEYHALAEKKESGLDRSYSSEPG